MVGDRHRIRSIGDAERVVATSRIFLDGPRDHAGADLYILAAKIGGRHEFLGQLRRRQVVLPGRLDRARHQIASRACRTSAPPSMNFTRAFMLRPRYCTHHRHAATRRRRIDCGASNTSHDDIELGLCPGVISRAPRTSVSVQLSQAEHHFIDEQPKRGIRPAIGLRAYVLRVHLLRLGHRFVSSRHALTRRTARDGRKTRDGNIYRAPPRGMPTDRPWPTRASPARHGASRTEGDRPPAVAWSAGTA